MAFLPVYTGRVLYNSDYRVAIRDLPLIKK